MILHVDMDAFYASVEERDAPELRGQAIVVGGTPEGRGVVAAANYVARRHGIHSAMPSAHAKRLCPQALFLRPRMEHYASISYQIREIFEQVTPLVEPLALDEAFLDVHAVTTPKVDAASLGRQVKQAIFDSLNLIASVGVASNKYVAKIASDFDKPNGFVVVSPDQVEQFLAPLPVSRLWGVGKVTERALTQMGATTLGELRAFSKEVLQRRFGQGGNRLWELARGIDDRPVTPDREAKSISHETTFASDITDQQVLRSWVLELADQVARRLRREQLRGRRVQLKVRYADFRTLTRSFTFDSSTNSTETIAQSAIDLLMNRLPRQSQGIRLLGVGVSQFGTTERQRSLLEEPERKVLADLDQASDQIHEKFGAHSLGRASSLLGRPRRPNRPNDTP